MRHRLWRTVRAQLRDAHVLLQESRRSLLLFVMLVVAGGLVFHLWYVIPGTGRHPSFAEAIHVAFALIFFETLLPFPQEWYLQLPFFLLPILGLAVVADGVLRFGAALVNKQARGQKWQAAMASTFSNHVIVCGIGRVGYRVALELLRFDREVVAIERNPEGRFVERAEQLGIPVIIADARRSASLAQAGVERADAIIPCTDDELANLDIALDARQLNSGIKVVMRMFDAELARRVEKGFGIHTAFSTSALAAPIFAAAAMRVNVKHSFYLGDDLLILGESTVEPDSTLIGWSLERLETELDLSVVCYQSGATSDLHPAPNLRIGAGNKILVLASLGAVRQLDALSRPAAV